MNDCNVNLANGVEMKPLHDGRTAFVFVQDPPRVTLIGALPLATYLLVEQSKGMTLHAIRKTLLEKAFFPNEDQKRRFDHAVICAVGQMFELGVFVQGSE